MLVHIQTNYDDIDPEKSTRYIDDSWLNLDTDAREAYLTKLFNGGSGSWDGGNLREMRSTMIENYLAQ